MKQSILMTLILGLCIILFNCSENHSSAPEINQAAELAKSAPMLRGEVVCDFTNTPPTFWNGTVDFGPDGKYGLTFISHAPPRDFSQASPFIEDFVIYELGSDWTLPENVYLKGSHKGVVTYANKDPNPIKFRAQGKILEASGPLAAWLGCTTHQKDGWVEWISEGVPKGCTATMQIN